MIREEIKTIILKSLKELGIGTPDFSVEVPKEKEYGDYSTNVAMVLARKEKKNPAEIAKKIELEIKNQTGMFEKVEIAGPGFINFFLSKDCLIKEVKKILKEKSKYGNLKIGKEKINIEFISANPTGPLTLGNGRGGFGGDVLSNVLKKAGNKINREYYINDRGLQIEKLGHSVLGDEEAVYKGKYIEELKSRIKVKDAEAAGKKAAGIILKELIVPSVKKMGIKFDTWFREEKLHKTKEVDKIINLLKKKNLVYKKEGALWFKSTQFGDDKDRVLVRQNGERTYFASDIAYLNNKFKRGFNKLIIFVGADHYGYVKRMESATEALGYNKTQINFVLMQLVHLFENGKEIKMSKRAGTYVTIDELLDEVGLDVARFFFLQRGQDSHLNFDLELAKKKSQENPVYYIQYAYARISSILKKAGRLNLAQNLDLLNEEAELRLIKQLACFPEIVEEIALSYQIQRLSQYAVDLAEDFHRFYQEVRVLTEDKAKMQARLFLLTAVKITLKNVLDLMGVSAPSKM